MRGVSRVAVVAAVLAATTAGAPPASALTAAAFEGTMEIGCYGCGDYGPEGNSASFSVTGVWVNRLSFGGPGKAEFRIHTPIGTTCVVSGFFTGVMTVQTAVDDVTSDFVMTYLGNQGVLTVPGVGIGAISMAVTEPHGNPCGGPVSMRFVGEVVGA